MNLYALIAAAIVAVTGFYSYEKYTSPGLTNVTMVTPCIVAKWESKDGKVSQVPTSNGYQYTDRLRDKEAKVISETTITHCVPCSSAQSKAEKYVCEGGEKK